MNKKFIDGIYFGLGLALIFGLIGIVSAVGFHSASEILPGTFDGSYKFTGGDLDIEGATFVKNSVDLSAYTRYLHSGTGGSTHIDTFGGSGHIYLNYFSGMNTCLGNGSGSGIVASFLANGNVGIGDTNPSSSLDIESNENKPGIQVRTTAAFTGTGGTGFVFIRLANESSTGPALRFENAGTGPDIRFDDRDTAPAVCMRGDMYVDTSGAFCGCTATNTWTNMVAVGTCS